MFVQHKGAVIYLLLCMWWVCFVAGAVSLSPVYETKHGRLQGLMLEDGSQQFLGIPYAQPPIGSLRWKAPQPLSWKGTYLANSYGLSCPQTFSVYIPVTLTNTSEDCLTLNIFVPPSTPMNNSKNNNNGNSTNSTGLLPVMFWIHGGGWIVGGSSQYPSSKLAAEANAIVVTTNYRLGVFGFLALEELVHEDNMLNYGLLDQQMALSWVATNIVAFGGNASNVMLFGESAGGASVGLHLLMKRSWTLYKDAALESPGPWLIPPLNLAVEHGNQFRTKAGCNSLYCLRALTTKQVMQAAVAVDSPFYSHFIPCIDQVQLRANPARLFSRGDLNPVASILIGDNAHEGNFFLFFLNLALFNSTAPVLTRVEYERIAAVMVPAQWLPTVLPWYDGLVSQAGYYQAMSQLQGDLWINCGSSIISNGAVAAGNTVWRYLFNQTTVNSPLRFLGITHLAEVPYVFHDPGLLGMNVTFTPQENEVSVQMVHYWSQFGRTGDPNTGGQNAFHWPRYKRNEQMTLVLQYNYTTVNRWNDYFCNKWKSFLIQGLLPESQVWVYNIWL